MSQSRTVVVLAEGLPDLLGDQAALVSRTASAYSRVMSDQTRELTQAQRQSAGFVLLVVC